jgi:putative membrane protein
MATKPQIVKSAEKLKDSAAEMKGSATRMEQKTARMENSAGRRTELAANRTVFAAERTYAAWVRTGLVALASGMGAKALLEAALPHGIVVLTGTVLVAFAAFCFAAAVWRNIDPGAPPPVPDVKRIDPWVLVVVNGFLVLVSLAALTGIWFGHDVL